MLLVDGMRIGDWGMGNGEWGMGVLAGSTGGLTEWRVNRSTAGFDVNTKASGSERAMPDKSLVYCPGTTDLRRLFRSGTGNQAARGRYSFRWRVLLFLSLFFYLFISLPPSIGNLSFTVEKMHTIFGSSRVSNDALRISLFVNKPFLFLS